MKILVQIVLFLQLSRISFAETCFHFDYQLNDEHSAEHISATMKTPSSTFINHGDSSINNTSSKSGYYKTIFIQGNKDYFQLLGKNKPNAFNLYSGLHLNDSSRVKPSYYLTYTMGANSAYRKLSLMAESYPWVSDYMEYLNETEIPDINGGLHLGIGKYFKNYFSIATGFSFDIFSYSSAPLDSIYLGSDPTTGAIYLSGKYKYQYRLFSIPFEFGFKQELLYSKLIVFASIGASAGYLKEVFYINGHKPSSIPSEAHPIKKMFHFNYKAAMGIGFPLSKKLALFYEYSYQRSINKIGVRYQILQTLWFHEFSLGLRYNLFK